MKIIKLRWLENPAKATNVFVSIESISHFFDFYASNSSAKSILYLKNDSSFYCLENSEQIMAAIDKKLETGES